MSAIKFVSEVPAVKRGRPTDPAVIEVRKALDAKAGSFAEVMAHEDAATARKFAKSISRDEAYEATTRQGADAKYRVYARRIAKAE